MRLLAKRSFLVIVAFFFTLSSFLAYAPSIQAANGADFQANNIISDSIFFHQASMSPQEIQAFLNAKVPTCDTNGTQMYSSTQTRAQYGTSKGYPPPYTCLKNFSQTVPSMPADQYCSGTVSGGTKSAAQILYDVSLACGVSPKVMLVLLQKEQSLITDDWPWSIQYTKATGYACPDSDLDPSVDANNNNCEDEYEGFFKQVYYGARQYQRYAKRPDLYNFASGRTSFVQWNVPASCGGTNLTMRNSATAGLYNYTPYQPNAAALSNLYGTGDSCSAYGNRNFWRMFTDWFGGTIGVEYYQCQDGVNFTGYGTGARIVRNRINANPVEALTLTFINKTGSACTENHTWRTGQQSWISNVATNHRALSPADNLVISGNFAGDYRSDLTLIKYRNSSSGKIELHSWTQDNYGWALNAATNHPSISPAGAKIIAADTDGNGVDELILVKLNGGGSGKIEVHTWSSDFKSWHSNIATNHPPVLASNASVVAGDTNGDGKDELMLVKYRNSGSGKIEVHTWLPGYQNWYNNIATNHPGIPPYDNEIISADTDGVGIDKLKLIKYRGGGSGKIEVHTWMPNYQSWYSNVATNHPAIVP